MSKQKNDHNFLLLALGKVWGYLTKAIGPSNRNLELFFYKYHCASFCTEEEKPTNSCNRGERKESNSRKNKQKIKQFS